jgi:hypothetical protein
MMTNLTSAGVAVALLGLAPAQSLAADWVTDFGSVWVNVHPTSYGVGPPGVSDWLYDVSDATFGTLGAPDATFLPSAPNDLQFNSDTWGYTSPANC